jgi:hypothetical protein
MGQQTITARREPIGESDNMRSTPHTAIRTRGNAQHMYMLYLFADKLRGWGNYSCFVLGFEIKISLVCFSTQYDLVLTLFCILYNGKGYILQ